MFLSSMSNAAPKNCIPVSLRIRISVHLPTLTSPQNRNTWPRAGSRPLLPQFFHLRRGTSATHKGRLLQLVDIMAVRRAGCSNANGPTNGSAQSIIARPGCTAPPNRSLTPSNPFPNRNTIPHRAVSPFSTTTTGSIPLLSAVPPFARHPGPSAAPPSPASSSPRRNYKHSFHTKSRWRCPGLSETSPARVAFSLRIATRPLPTTAPLPHAPSSFQRFPRSTLFQICTITGRAAANADSSDARSFRLTISRAKKFFRPSPSGCFSSGRIRMRKY